ncbi:hypothetical protein [Flavobacterium limnophilum]|uniref:hypothetical protein n=1 Tax=Flavobacterium limnophilum TaxID=3003262 RepID=UPI0022AC1EB3|nr:hypothetical protein [Flavobacterium limnophilum]
MKKEQLLTFRGLKGFGAILISLANVSFVHKVYACIKREDKTLLVALLQNIESPLSLQ